MLQSVMARLAFLCTLVLLILAVPIFYFINAEASPLHSSSVKEPLAQSNASNLLLGETQAEEEPVVQIASLEIASDTPKFEILEPLGTLKSDTAARVERASELSKDRRFDEALAVLDGVHNSSRDDYSVKFMEARVLAWSGRHKQAEQQFGDLRAKYPKDLDILVSYGYLQFYQRNYLASERVFVEVLQLNPDYGDARRGLERARQARKKI